MWLCLFFNSKRGDSRHVTLFPMRFESSGDFVGVTCGGKTTLAQQLLSALTPAVLVQQDKYFLPDDSPRHVPVEGLAHNNYDILSALDMDAMYRCVGLCQRCRAATRQRANLSGLWPCSDVVAALEGERAAPAPAPADARRVLQGKKLLIIEGFSILNYKPIMELCDLRCDPDVSASGSKSGASFPTCTLRHLLYRLVVSSCQRLQLAVKRLTQRKSGALY